MKAFADGAVKGAAPMSCSLSSASLLPTRWPKFVKFGAPEDDAAAPKEPLCDAKKSDVTVGGGGATLAPNAGATGTPALSVKCATGMTNAAQLWPASNFEKHKPDRVSLTKEQSTPSGTSKYRIAFSDIPLRRLSEADDPPPPGEGDEELIWRRLAGDAVSVSVDQNVLCEVGAMHTNRSSRRAMSRATFFPL